MENQKENRALTLFISFLVAVFLWAYATGDSDNMAYRRFENIPILATNTTVLEQNNYTIILEKDTVTYLRIYGKGSVIAGLNNDNIQASVNLSNITQPGEYTLPVSISGLPSDVNVVKQTPAKIKIKVDIKTSKDIYNPSIKSSGSAQSGYDVVSVNSKDKKIKVTGPSENVNKVAGIEGVVDVDGVSDDFSDDVKLYAVDLSGKKIKEVSLSPSSTSVSVGIGEVKEVSVKVKTKGDVNDGYVLTGATSSTKTVEIACSSEKADEIESISTKPVNVNGKSESYETNIKLDIPDGVRIVSGKSKVKVSVSIDKDDSKTISVTSYDFDNLKAGYKAKVLDDKVTVLLSGRNSILRKVSASDIQGIIDLDGYDKKGTYNVDIKISTKGLPKGVKIKSSSKSSVKVKIY